MTTPETQTDNIEAKPWNELDHPINYVGTPYLDETTVPDEKRAIYETVLAAHHSDIDQERENAEAAAKMAQDEKQQAFLAERRKNALARIDTIAVHSAMESNLEEPVIAAPVYHAAPDGSLITEAEAKDMREAREIRSQL